MSCKWIHDNHNIYIKNEDYHKFYHEFRNKTLLNAGIVGGKSHIVKEFLDEIIRFYYENDKKLGVTDMATFNFIAYTKFKEIVKHGSIVNTEFKKFDTRNITPFFRHK